MRSETTSSMYDLLKEAGLASPKAASSAACSTEGLQYPKRQDVLNTSGTSDWRDTSPPASAKTHGLGHNPASARKSRHRQSPTLPVPQVRGPATEYPYSPWHPIETGLKFDAPESLHGRFEECQEMLALAEAKVLEREARLSEFSERGEGDSPSRPLQDNALRIELKERDAKIAELQRALEAAQRGQVRPPPRMQARSASPTFQAEVPSPVQVHAPDPLQAPTSAQLEKLLAKTCECAELLQKLTAARQRSVSTTRDYSPRIGRDPSPAVARLGRDHSPLVARLWPESSTPPADCGAQTESSRRRNAPSQRLHRGASPTGIRNTSLRTSFPTSRLLKQGLQSRSPPSNGCASDTTSLRTSHGSPRTSSPVTQSKCPQTRMSMNTVAAPCSSAQRGEELLAGPVHGAAEFDPNSGRGFARQPTSAGGHVSTSDSPESGVPTEQAFGSSRGPCTALNVMTPFGPRTVGHATKTKTAVAVAPSGCRYSHGDGGACSCTLEISANGRCSPPPRPEQVVVSCGGLQPGQLNRTSVEVSPGQVRWTTALQPTQPQLEMIAQSPQVCAGGPHARSVSAHKVRRTSSAGSIVVGGQNHIGASPQMMWSPVGRPSPAIDPWRQSVGGAAAFAAPLQITPTPPAQLAAAAAAAAAAAGVVSPPRPGVRSDLSRPISAPHFRPDRSRAARHEPGMAGFQQRPRTSVVGGLRGIHGSAGGPALTPPNPAPMEIHRPIQHQSAAVDYASAQNSLRTRFDRPTPSTGTRAQKRGQFYQNREVWGSTAGGSVDHGRVVPRQPRMYDSDASLPDMVTL